ncbi:tyrosyl-DNA phosphodiesterase-domain-containing protein [Leucosporidium creatinivorum]|uniref:Tyrosyl-DNA phosphodiesterase-domain-containing protein n=1 Tax=Leucosporidium creatinivorum TaxID=106004 RepID=A0A1Y2G145_9BASI|nr:tyrosyl-DNA phosphodiesterase-domain-containing protein [Leucosporidium creatinivorum]
MSTSKRPFDVVLDDSDDEEANVGAVGEQDDSFEQQLARAIALSKVESQRTSSRSNDSSQVATSSTTAPAPAPAPVASGSSAGGSGLAESRQEMERARLERQKQRKASGAVAAPRVVVDPPSSAPRSPPSPTCRTTLPMDSRHLPSALLVPACTAWPPSAEEEVRARRLASSQVPSSASPTSTYPTTTATASERSSRWRRARDGHRRRVLPRRRVGLLALRSCYSALARHASSKGDVQGALAEVDAAIKPNTYRVIPEMRPSGNPQYCCMHTKMIVLYFKTFVRIIIPTANAMDYDWAIIDNAFYVHDFPLRRDVAMAAADPRDNPTHTQFSSEFLEVMHTLGVPKRFVSLYKKWDYSSSKVIRLIATVQGTWHGWNEIKKGGGLPGLATQVRSMGFSEGGKWQIEATGSSVGTLTSNWLAQMMGACEGFHPKKYFRKGNSAPPHLPQRPASVPTQLPIKIAFPTLDEINGSWSGQNHGGTIFFPEKLWTSNTFPKHLLHRGVSKRHRVPAHTKTIVAIHKPKSNLGPDFKHEGFVYFGSHNFTQAAWGRLQIASRDGEPELVANNYELGVLLPIRGSSEQDVENKASELATFKRPLVKYLPTDVPWMQGVHRS